MFQDDLKNHIDEVKNEFEDYVDKRISLLKLHLVEELSRFTAGFAVKLGILYLLFFVFMFLSLAAAFFFGDLLGSNRSEEHTSELQSRPHLVCRLLLEKKKK